MSKKIREEWNSTWWHYHQECVPSTVLLLCEECLQTDSSNNVQWHSTSRFSWDFVCRPLHWIQFESSQRVPQFPSCWPINEGLSKSVKQAKWRDYSLKNHLFVWFMGPIVIKMTRVDLRFKRMWFLKQENYGKIWKGNFLLWATMLHNISFSSTSSLTF